MSNTYKWTISALEAAPLENSLQNVVKIIHWRLMATDGEHTAESYSSLGLDAPVAEQFVAFENLTEADVISWLESKLDTETLKANLDQQIETLKNPPIVTKPAPWLVSANT